MKLNYIPNYYNKSEKECRPLIEYVFNKSLKAESEMLVRQDVYHPNQFCNTKKDLEVLQKILDPEKAIPILLTGHEMFDIIGMNPGWDGVYCVHKHFRHFLLDDFDVFEDHLSMYGMHLTESGFEWPEIVFENDKQKIVFIFPIEYYNEVFNKLEFENEEAPEDLKWLLDN